MTLELSKLRKISKVHERLQSGGFWIAVLTRAILDWKSGDPRAAAFLFRNGEDFAEVCTRAGLDPSRFRAKLERIPKRVGAPLET